MNTKEVIEGKANVWVKKIKKKITQKAPLHWENPSKRTCCIYILLVLGTRKNENKSTQIENFWSWRVFTDNEWVFSGWYQKAKLSLDTHFPCTLVHCSVHFLSNFTLEIIVLPASCAHTLRAGEVEAS